MESGRYMTGPHGALVVTAINRKDIYRTYIGVDACMSALMRPAMYGAYHHITVPGRTSRPSAGAGRRGRLALREQRQVRGRSAICPRSRTATFWSSTTPAPTATRWGSTTTASSDPKELLLRRDGSVELIRRAETHEDLFATLTFAPDMMPG